MKIIVLWISILLLFDVCNDKGNSSEASNYSESAAVSKAAIIENNVESHTVEKQNKINTYIFSQLPKSFIFASGAGAWGTCFNLNPDGTFTGNFHDTDAGICRPEYPKGTVFICSFDGKFTDVKQIDEYSYSMKLDYLNCDGTPEDEYFENGRRYVYSAPRGLEDAEEFMIYLPGAPLANLSEKAMLWVHISADEYTVVPDGRYIIYNVNRESAFIGSFEYN